MKKLALASCLLLVAACSGPTQKSATTTPTTPAAPSAPAPAAPTAPATGEKPAASAPTMDEGSTKPVAEINGVVITEGELNAKISDRLSKVRSQIYDLQRQGVVAMINEKLIEEEAKKNNVSVAELLKQQVDSKVAEPSDQEIQAMYEKVKSRLGGKPLEEVKEALRQQVKAQKATALRNQFLDKLRSQAKVAILLERPVVNVSVDDDPSWGNENAPVTIIEFTDFQCPFCARARDSINQVKEAYKDKVRIVQRDFPLSFHSQAQKASEAAQCAHEQGKFWEYSDVLWSNQKALDVPSLKKYAADLKLDTAKFDSCLDTDKYAEEVKKDMQDGSKVGVSGTPAFFINGQMLTGARPFEAFKEVIDMELLTNAKK